MGCVLHVIYLLNEFILQSFSRFLLNSWIPNNIWPFHKSIWIKLLKKRCQELVAMAGSHMWGYVTDNVGGKCGGAKCGLAVSSRNPSILYGIFSCICSCLLVLFVQKSFSFTITLFCRWISRRIHTSHWDQRSCIEKPDKRLLFSVWYEPSMVHGNEL